MGHIIHIYILSSLPLAPSTAAPVRFSDELYNTPFSSSFYSIQKANFFQTVTINLRRGGSAFLDCTPQGHISPPFWSASDNHCWSIPGNDFVKVCDYHLTSLPYCQYILGHTTIARGFKFLNATSKFMRIHVCTILEILYCSFACDYTT